MTPTAGTGLHYVSDTEPGIRRVGRPGAFRYLYGRRVVTGRQTLERIRHLAIPPAYTDVWICRDERGHLQATGRDARGRKQYRYHPLWRQSKDVHKFDRMVEFGKRLPGLRRRLKADLARPGLPREKILATVVTLLQDTLIRVGNREYVKQNGSFGLTTLRDRHVRFLPHQRAALHFRGKSGQRQDVILDDRQLTRILRKCHDLPGQQLFQYRDGEGAVRGVDSSMVNAYLLETLGSAGDGEGFTAKDFRTWGATVSAIGLLEREPLPTPLPQRVLKSTTVAVCQKVAAELGNTPAVCRKAYINPWVFTAWSQGLIAPRRPSTAHAAERRVLTLLRRGRRNPKAEAE